MNNSIKFYSLIFMIIVIHKELFAIIQKETVLNETLILENEKEHKEWGLKSKSTFEYKGYHNTLDFYTKASDNYFYNSKTSEMFSKSLKYENKFLVNLKRDKSFL